MTSMAGIAASETEDHQIGEASSQHELQTSIAVIGGGLGGCAAALAALKAGLNVVLTEETDWLGGQVTSQAVPPDEHPWIESIANPSYAEFRKRIRDYYKRNYPLTHEALTDPFLNPGRGNVSKVCCEPRAALAALEEMLAPYRANGQLRVLLEHVPVGAQTEGDEIRAVRLEDRANGGEKIIHAPYFLDATELGDLLDLAKVEHVTGAESQGQTGEKHAPEKAAPDNMQAITWCFPVEYRHGEDHTIDRPDRYDFWRNYVPPLSPPWPGPLLSKSYTHPITLEPISRPIDPIREGKNEVSGFWRYRRIRYAGYYEPSFPGHDISLINWPMNDYVEGNLFNISPEEKERHTRDAKQLSLSLLYWLQTEAPHDDEKGQGWPGLRLCPEITGTEDGLAKAPYIRESRRLVSKFTITEAHVGTEMRMEITGLPKEEVKALPFGYSVGIGSYRIDLHPSTGGDNYIDISSLPFQIHLGSLIPVRVTNLLAACKNIGTTHITNGCYRLHPVEWNVGEAAGYLAAWCLKNGKNPHQVYHTEELREDYQIRLKDENIPLSWPEFRPR
ncbi:MAG: FAD-dependent oxidoreductase [Candidatus Omnitrophica bacterium]|nr:FAD-dependent oxidoreductase [Candidatus Omnitrophota bacterium]